MVDGHCMIAPYIEQFLIPPFGYFRRFFARERQIC